MPPGSSAYKTNVNRQKTRKWIEARVQSYDGDDWGNEYDDEEPDDELDPPKHSDAHAPSQPVNPPGQARATQPAAPTSAVRQYSASGFQGAAMDPSTSQGQTPSAPQSGAAAVPSRFPPRKESITAQDVPDASDLACQPGPQQRWAEGRPASPQGAKSPGTPGKPLPIIRPADIYRRHMEQEREKERRSADSSRPSLDSSLGRAGERPGSPAKTPQDAAVTVQHVDDAPEDVSDAASGPKSDVELVAEPRSEFGSTGLGIVASQGQGAPAESTATNNFGQQPGFVSQQCESVRSPAWQQEDRQRFSTSPKLPDLARLSAFGEDLFSNPASSPRSFPDGPSLSATADSSATPMTPENLAPAEKPGAAGAQPTSPTGAFPEASPAAAKPPKGIDDAVSREVAAAPSSEQSTDFRTDTPRGLESGPASILHPSSFDKAEGQQDPEHHVLARAGSPISEHDESEEEEDNKPAGTQQVPGGSSEQPRSEPSRMMPVPSLPPLRTTDGTSSPNTAAEGASSPSPRCSTEPHASSPASVGVASEIAPTAPLNPNKHHVPDEFQSEGPARTATMSTITNPSPAKESDRLREEIIRSLSPERPSEDHVAITGEQSSSMSARQNTRESSYLSDVYGDYWSPSEDLPEQKASQDVKIDNAIMEEEPVSYASQEPETKRDSSDVPASVPPAQVTPAAEPEARPALNRNRFSWEVDPDEGNISPGPGITPSPGVEVAMSPLSDFTQPSEAAIASPALGTEGPPTKAPDGDGPEAKTDAGVRNISHPVSQLSIVPTEPGSPGLEPPSPVSMMTDKNGPASPPATAGIRELSLAEEKGGAQSSYVAVSPTPPMETHPALADVSRPSAEAAPAVGSGGKTQVPAFREILDLPTIKQRIETYRSTRTSFASGDIEMYGWLGTMRAQGPEHGTSTSSLRDNIFNAHPQLSPVRPGSGPQAVPAEQPYYQQYLNANASSPGLQGSHSGRIGLSASSSMPYTSSDLRHSSGQVGAKSKELLLAAGKASKGLFSKGKNKLRGSGDRVLP